MLSENKKMRFIGVPFIPLTIAIFTALFTFFTYLRYVDFFTSNWDFGIMEQMLWTGSHGYLLYESANFVHAGALSFLEIHSTYIALPLSFLYGLFPNPITLLLLQSLVISLSIIPISYISRKIGLSSRIGSLVSVIFLTNFAIISAIFYDFHWEAFIPIEFFAAFALMLNKNYKLVLLVLLIGDCTLEVFPFLMVGMSLFFLVDFFNRDFINPRKVLSTRDGRRIAFVLVMSAFSYLIIRLAQATLIPFLVGQPQTPSDVTYYVSTLFMVSLPSFFNLGMTSYYWIMLYLSLGFLPLIYPKHLIMALPWLINTFVLYPSYASGFGNQYAFVAFPPLFIGFIYGLKKSLSDRRGVPLPRFNILLVCIIAFIGTYSYILSVVNTSSRSAYIDLIILDFLVLTVWLILLILRRKDILLPKFFGNVKTNNEAPEESRKFKKFVLFSVVIVLFSIVLSPLNTANENLYGYPGYSFQYEINNEYSYVKEIAAQIPEGSQILASDNLFPFVANNPNAFSLYWFPFNSSMAPFFPFNATHLPDYLFVASSQISMLPDFLTNELLNGSAYGLVYQIISYHYPGSVYLYREGYSGSTTTFDLQA